MTVICAGYAITYEKNMNRIIISLPQTLETATNTAQKVSNRKTDFTEAELAEIVYIVRAIAERISGAFEEVSGGD